MNNFRLCNEGEAVDVILRILNEVIELFGGKNTSPEYFNVS